MIMTPSLHHMVFTLLNKHPGVLQNDHFYLSSGKHVMAESFEVSDRWFPAVNWTALTWRNIVGSMCAYRPLTIAACTGFSESLNLRECLLASFLSIGTVIKPLEACQNDFVLQVLIAFPLLHHHRYSMHWLYWIYNITTTQSMEDLLYLCIYKTFTSPLKTVVWKLRQLMDTTMS